MADSAGLLSSTAPYSLEDKILSTTAEIQKLQQDTLAKEQKYLNAPEGEKAAFKAVWESADRREERASRYREELQIAHTASMNKGSGEFRTGCPKSTQ